MTLPDINVWVALTVSNHEHHAAAVRWLETQQALVSLAFCRVTQQGYLRLLSNAKMMSGYGLPPLTNAPAWASYQALLADDRVTFLAEPGGIEPLWRDFGARDPASTKLWMDAFLAAFAISSGLRFVTLDADFKSFVAQGLDLVLLNPAA